LLILFMHSDQPDSCRAGDERIAFQLEFGAIPSRCLHREMARSPRADIVAVVLYSQKAQIVIESFSFSFDLAFINLKYLLVHEEMPWCWRERQRKREHSQIFNLNCFGACVSVCIGEKEKRKSAKTVALSCP